MTTAIDNQRALAGELANEIAVRLASPARVTALVRDSDWWPQCLATGAAGVALLHIERARAGLGSRQRAHDWLAHATADGIEAGSAAHLYYGAPAIAYALTATGGDGIAQSSIETRVEQLVRRRLAAAWDRLDRRALPELSEFDAIRGLAGLGGHLLRRDPGGELIRELLTYLVRLTLPVKDGGDLLPGWWTPSGPDGRPSGKFTGGHGNHGMAHGIGGPLAVLSLTMRTGVIVDGQAQAIRRICGWLDHWSDEGGHWPYWITREQLRRGPPGHSGPSSPSWCYGAAGLGRARQLAAIALGDPALQRRAEEDLARALTDPAQLGMVSDASLCHGWAGLLRIAMRSAADALLPELARIAPPLLARLLPPDGDAETHASRLITAGGVGLLAGAAGVGLALDGVRYGTASGMDAGWDACLLIG